VVAIEATGSMQRFLELLDELGVQYRVGHPAKIRAAEPRKQKHDRRDARLILELLTANRFPDIWMPSIEQRDLRILLRARHQWVKMRARLQHTLQSIALNHALRKGTSLWTAAGLETLQRLPLPPYTSQRRNQLLRLSHANTAEVFSPYLKASRGFADYPNRNRTLHRVKPKSDPLVGTVKSERLRSRTVFPIGSV
jgi:transposase